MNYFIDARKTLFSVKQPEILPPLDDAFGTARYGSRTTIASSIIENIDHKKLPETYIVCPAILKALSRIVSIGLHHNEIQYEALGGVLVNEAKTVLLADYWDGIASDVPAGMKNSDRRILLRVETTGNDVHYKAAVVENGIFSPYIVRHDSAVHSSSGKQHSPGAALFAMILAGFTLKNFFNDDIQRMIQPQFSRMYSYFAAGKDKEGCEEASSLANDLYALFAKKEKAGDLYGYYPYDTDMPEQFEQLHELDLRTAFDNWTRPIGGKVHLADPQQPETIKTAARIDPMDSANITELAGKYPLDPERVLTAEEKLLVPAINPNYAVPDKLEYAARITTARTTTVMLQSFIMPCGTGKTEWSKIFAATLNLPYVCMTCGKSMTADDLLTTIIPAGEGKKAFDFTGLPSAGEWFMNPVESYLRITGRQNADATPDDCQAAYTEAVLKESGISSKGFRYVDSPLVAALRNGWLVEVQEPTVLHSDVLVQLNSLFDNCRTVQLQTGEMLMRHPDAVVVFTSNTGYAGTEPFQESVRTRFRFVKLKRLTDEEMISRLKNVTGFRDEAVLLKMVHVFRTTEEKCRQAGINLPTYRNIESWATCNTANGMFYSNGIEQFIGGITDDEDEQASLIPCVESQFTQYDD